jgi:hypothetical protein
MSGLIADKNANAPLDQADVITSPRVEVPARYTDAAVLAIIRKDRETASAWLNSNKWQLQWRESNTLYQSPKGYGTFEGSNVTRSNLSDFTVATQVNSLAPAMQQAIFSDPALFAVQPRPNVSSKTARAWAALLGALLEESDFKAEMMAGTETQTTLGTAIFKCGWETVTKIETHMVRKAAPAQVTLPLQQTPMTVYTEESDQFDAVDSPITRNRPWFEQIPLGELLIDPKWNKPNQLWRARWVIHEKYVTYEDLNQLRDNPLYDIPSEEELREALRPTGEQTLAQDATADTFKSDGATHAAEEPDQATSEDPLEKPLQISERWTPTMCQVTLQDKIVIRNGEHMLPAMPFFSANFWNMLEAGYGMGVGRLAGSNQRLSQGSTNAALDILSIAVQPDYLVQRGANVPTQQMRQRLAGITMVTGDVREAFALKPQPKVDPDVWRLLQLNKMTSEGTTGADQAMMQGTMPGRGSSVGRTAAGASGLQKAASVRIQAPVDKMVDGVLLPFIKFLWQMVRERMPTSEIRSILGDQMTADLLPDMYDFMNAKLKFDVLAGTRLAAKAQMAQSLPFILQIFDKPAVTQSLNTTGLKIDYQEVVSMVMEVSGWKNQRQLIVPLTPADQQAMQAQNGGLQKLQAMAAQQQQKHQNDMELEDQKIQGRITAKVVDHAVQGQAQQQSLAMDPSNRAVNFAERDADERQVQSSPFFG